MIVNNRVLEKIVRAGVYGFAVGDALGVPGEFLVREQLKAEPITTMIGGGSHGQPRGTWSDDTSLVLATMAGVTRKGVDLEQIMNNFVAWLDEGKYTPAGKVFDVGGTTRQALEKYKRFHDLAKTGGSKERHNGNGSLMRILPLAFVFWAQDPGKEKLTVAEMTVVARLSALTHAHAISVVACWFYLSVILAVMRKHGAPRACVHQGVNWVVRALYLSPEQWGEYRFALAAFENLLAPISPLPLDLEMYSYRENFPKLAEAQIKSSGYVVETLEAVLWCFLVTTNYHDCVLKAVNLGGDTDTIAALAGGLAGSYYGLAEIPLVWLEQLAGREQLEEQIAHLVGVLG